MSRGILFTIAVLLMAACDSGPSEPCTRTKETCKGEGNNRICVVTPDC